MDADWEGAGDAAAGAGGWQARVRERSPQRPGVSARATPSPARSRRLLARLFGGSWRSAWSPAWRWSPRRDGGRARRAGGVLTAVGRVAAMAGTYLLLVTLLLIARIPAVERASARTAW